MPETLAGRPRVPAYRIVGVIHLPALPGTVQGGTVTDLAAILERAKRDADTYAIGGVDALMVENFGDVPFAKGRVGAYTVAAMTLATDLVRAETGLPVGVNVLRNDVESAVSIAAATGAAFVRANVYVGAAITDQGLIEGRADRVQALIKRLGAPVAVWADVDVKHAAQPAPRPVGELAADAVERGLAAAVIVTGSGTGRPVGDEDLAEVRSAVPGTPIYAGSGARPESVSGLLQYADGVIAGTAMKVDGIVTNPVDLARVRAFVQAVR